MSDAFVLVPNKRNARVIVSIEDAERVLALRWNVWQGKDLIHCGHSVCVDGKITKIPLHRFVIGAEPGVIVDHINGDRLDNRRSNLRVTDRFGNARNSTSQARGISKFKGVAPVSSGKSRWRAQIHVGGKQLHLGCFATEADAARAYDEAARLHFGEFATLNFPNAHERSSVHPAFIATANTGEAR